LLAGAAAGAAPITGGAAIAGGGGATGAAIGGAGIGAAAGGIGARETMGFCAIGLCATATVPARPIAPGDGTGAARTPCGGVCGENGFGAAALGSSAPQPRQNL
jgi:hypothetical protein